MHQIRDYNIIKYMDSIVGGCQMTLDGILSPYKKCKKYSLSADVAEYLKYIGEKPFYIAPSFSDVKTDPKLSSLKPKFVLLSAPGAAGKSALAKYIAYKFDAIYWNLAKVKVGTNSFAGSIISAVDAPNYSNFIADLNSGNVLLVIDAFDEAEIISGRKMLDSFIADISKNLSCHQLPTVFLLARTETAQYLASFCAENGIAVAHYEIGFFGEENAKEFIVESIAGEKVPTAPDRECADKYYSVIKGNITKDECASFLGYAPVLEAISAHIKSCPNRQKMISGLSNQKDCVSIITKIMEDLLSREQVEKAIPAFRERCASLHPEFNDWDKVYSAEEQLVRVIYYILFQDCSYKNYPLNFLPPQLVDEYQSLLDTFLPQHPFVRNSVKEENASVDFTGPAFRDYALAKIILNKDHETLADMYFEYSQSQSYFPSQIFFDCYMQISKRQIFPRHISYVYDSFKAKATAYERPYLECSEILGSETEDMEYAAVFGMMPAKKQATKREDYIANIAVMDEPLKFEQLVNVSIDAPDMEVSVGRDGVDSRIYNSSIVCRKINWGTKHISIESYAPEASLLVAHDGFSGEPTMIEIVKADDFKVTAPNINAYYSLIPYKYDFEDAAHFDIIKFIHGMRCIFIEFRTHRKDTLAKSAERIEFVTVGNSTIKRQILSYLKDCGIIYESAHLYKIDEAKMQEKRIFFNALARMDTQLMNTAFSDFCEWLQNNN
jgi:hypothetical protein